MRFPFAPLALALLTTSAVQASDCPVGPQLTPPQDQAQATPKPVPFHLHGIVSERVAVWPIPSVDLNEDAVKTVYEEYPDDIAFLDKLQARLAKRIQELTRPELVGPETLIKTFKGDASTRSFLIPEKLLKGLKASSRFSMAADSPLLDALCASSALKGVRFAVIPTSFKVGRSTSYVRSGAYTSMPAPSGGGLLGAGAPASKTTAELAVTVLDLQEKQLVWEGTFVSVASSNFMKGVALHEVEDDLVEEVAKEIQNQKHTIW